MNIRTGAGNVIKKVPDRTTDTYMYRVYNLHGHLLNRSPHSLLLVLRNRTAQVVRKQFPLRPAAAKTIHRSQGDTETRIVVNFDTGRAIPHIHYVGQSRVTTIEGLHVN